MCHPKVFKIVNVAILSPSPIKPDGHVNTCVSRDFFFNVILSVLPSVQNDVVFPSPLLYPSSPKRRRFPHVHHGKPEHARDTRPRWRQHWQTKPNHTKSKTSTTCSRKLKLLDLKRTQLAFFASRSWTRCSLLGRVQIGLKGGGIVTTHTFTKRRKWKFWFPCIVMTSTTTSLEYKLTAEYNFSFFTMTH
jgi:hypothetical protein